MAMSNKPVSIDPANAGKDETKPEVELVTKRQTITPEIPPPSTATRCDIPENRLHTI